MVIAELFKTLIRSDYEIQTYLLKSDVTFIVLYKNTNSAKNYEIKKFVIRPDHYGQSKILFSSQ